MSQILAHPTLDAVIGIHKEVLSAHGGSKGLRDKTLLESALAAPQASMAGKTLMTDPVEVAAAYLFYICRNHPFVDGNKRTALATCLVFLAENNGLPNETLDTDQWDSMVMDIASSMLDRDQTTERLRRLLSDTSRIRVGRL